MSAKDVADGIGLFCWRIIKFVVIVFLISLAISALFSFMSLS